LKLKLKKNNDMASQKLVRSKDKIIAGVCGGIAEYMGVDPTVIRILYVFASIFTAAFPGILVYIIMWLIMPEN
jgi:phage shock protein PspC (stress-responsive transcriptional regulator)